MAQNVDYTALQDVNLAALREKYPACVLPEVMALGKEELGEEERRELAVAINVRVGDPDTLVSLLGADIITDIRFFRSLAETRGAGNPQTAIGFDVVIGIPARFTT